MRNVFLHIGMPKTGTTTLQFLMDSNRSVLRDNGCLYPLAGISASPHQKGHHDLVRAVKNKDLKLFDELVSEVEGASLDDVVISSEEFMSLSPQGIEFVGERFVGFNVKVIVYLREQAEFLESLYNQAVKTGSETRDRHVFLAELLSIDRLNYYVALKNWSSVFGKENMIVRKYNSETSDKDALINDFLNNFGLDSSMLNTSTGGRNCSVSNKYIEFLRVVNKLGFDQETKNSKIVSVLLSADSHRGSDVSVFSPSERKLVRNYCRASNRMLEKEYFGGRRELFAQVDEDITVAPDQLSSELLAEIISIFIVADKR